MSSLIGIGGAYFVFWNGLRKEKEKERLRDKAELADFFSYFIFSIKRIIGPTISQLESFTHLCKQLEIKKALDYHFAEVATFNFKWYDEINKSKTQKAFFESYQGTDKDKFYSYNQLLRSFDLLSLISKDYRSNFDRFMVNSNQYQKSFKEKILVLMGMRDKIVKKSQALGGTAVNLSFLEVEFFNASKNWYSIDEGERYDLYKTYNEWIIPLTKMRYLYTDPDLIDTIRQITNAFANFERNHKVIYSTFQHYVKSMKNEISRIQVVLRWIDKKN